MISQPIETDSAAALKSSVNKCAKLAATVPTRFPICLIKVIIIINGVARPFITMPKAEIDPEASPMFEDIAEIRPIKIL